MISLGWSHLIVGLGCFYGGMMVMGWCCRASEADRQMETFERGRRGFEAIEEEADALEDPVEDDWDPAWGERTWTPESRGRA